MDLAKLNFDALVQLKSDIETELKRRKKQETSQLASLLSEKAAALGVSVDEIVGLLGKKANANKGKKLPAKFANPKNPAETWTGKGRKPGWFVTALSGGKTADQLLIK